MPTVLPVLMYHHVSPNPGLVTVSPTTFRAHMRFLAEHGYTTLTLAQFERHLAGEPVPPRSVLVTFDDGYLDNYVYAHPVLQEYGQTATLFVVTGWLGDGPARLHAGNGADLPDCPDHKTCKQYIAAGQADRVMLRWPEIDVMREAGSFEFHSHTHSHTRWDKQIPDRAARDRALADDLAQSRRTLLGRLGAVSEHLCWPQGFFDDGYIEVARAAGFRFLHTTRPGLVSRDTPATLIPRIVTKDKPGFWFASRMWLYRQPTLGPWYLSGKTA